MTGIYKIKKKKYINQTNLVILSTVEKYEPDICNKALRTDITFTVFCL